MNMGRHQRAALAIVAALSWTTFAGCPLNPLGPEPCDEDRFDCRNWDTLQVDSSCDLDGELLVEVGQGETSFAPLMEGGMPQVINGAQGGSHMFIALRILNPALDEYGQMLASIDLFSLLPVEAPECGADTLCTDCGFDPFVTVDGVEMCRQERVSFRKVKLGSNSFLHAGEDGALEEWSIMLFVPPEDALRARDHLSLELHVSDPCGQEGSARVRLGTDGLTETVR